jgi:hypothetical protein
LGAVCFCGGAWSDPGERSFSYLAGLEATGWGVEGEEKIQVSFIKKQKHGFHAGKT